LLSLFHISVNHNYSNNAGKSNSEAFEWCNRGKFADEE